MKKILAIIVVVILLVVAFMVFRNLQHGSKTNDATTTQKSTQQSGKTNGSVEQEQSPSVKDGVSSTQAGNIAVQQYGGTVKTVKSSEYQNKVVWEVDITDSPQGEIKVEVAQADGTVVGMSKVGTGN